jgi:hypothetical protein
MDPDPVKSVLDFLVIYDGVESREHKILKGHSHLANIGTQSSGSKNTAYFIKDNSGDQAKGKSPDRSREFKFPKVEEEGQKPDEKEG